MRGLRLAMGDGADIVDKQQVELFEAGALAAVVEAAHDAVIGIIEDFAERQAVVPAGIERVLRRCRRQRPSGALARHQPADLGADGRRLGLLPQEMAEQVFGAAEAVHRGGIEMTDAGSPGSLQRRKRRLGGNRRIEPAHRGRAHAKRRYLQASFPNRSPLTHLHGNLLAGPCEKCRPLLLLSLH